MKEELKAQNKFEEELLLNGYKFFKDIWKKSIKGIQKKVTDKKGIKYFITGYHYNISLDFPNAPNKDSYEFGVQFTYKNDGKSFTVNMNLFSTEFVDDKYGKITSIKEVEDYFENIFKKTKAVYYEEAY